MRDFEKNAKLYLLGEILTTTKLIYVNVISDVVEVHPLYTLESES